jgi:hypothetical protein
MITLTSPPNSIRLCRHIPQGAMLRGIAHYGNGLEVVLTCSYRHGHDRSSARMPAPVEAFSISCRVNLAALKRSGSTRNSE